MKQAIESGKFDVVLYPFNLVNNEAIEELIPLAMKNDIGFMAMKPFAGGRLTDSTLVMKYLLQFDQIVPVPGIEKKEEIDNLISILNGDLSLTQEDHEKIQEIRDSLGQKFCQCCSYCTSTCPQEIDIPMVINLKVMYDLWPNQDFHNIYHTLIEKAQSCIHCGVCETHCPYELNIQNLMEKGVEFYRSIT